MSHSYFHGDDPEKPTTTILHNSDLSGEVTIVNANGELKVEGRALIGFIADYVRGERISKLELEADDLALLGIAK